MGLIRKTYLCSTKAVDAEAGIYDLWISTEAIDRDGDILLAVGAVIDNYLRNPVVLYAHSYHDLPVAKALEVEIVSGQGLRARMQFPPKGISPRADEIHALWAGGFLNAASVGFNPSKWADRKPGPEETERWFPPRIYTVWELLEFSIVPVPANQDALRLAAKSLRPQPGEHACALRDPREFEPDSFQRVWRESDGKRYVVIVGKLRGEDTPTEQAYRYPAGTWTEAEARAHSAAHSAQKFEVATTKAPDMAEMRERMDAMQAAMDQMRERMDAMQAAMDQMQERMDAMQAAMDQMQEQMDALMAMMDDGAGDDGSGDGDEEDAAGEGDNEESGERAAQSPVIKRGRVLSAANETRIRSAAAQLQEVLAQIDGEQPEPEEDQARGHASDFGELPAVLLELVHSVKGVVYAPP